MHIQERAGVKRAAGGVRLIHTFVRQINSGKERKWVYAIWNSPAWRSGQSHCRASQVQVGLPVTCTLFLPGGESSSDEAKVRAWFVH